MTALDEQIGGNHYKDFAIQPIEFVHKNELGFIEGNVIKYICRHSKKGGLKDLEKAKHYIEILIEFHGKQNIPEENYRKQCESCLCGVTEFGTISREGCKCDCHKETKDV